MKLKTIAIDDEPLALRLVSDYISKTPFLELVGAFDNPLDAIEFLSANPHQPRTSRGARWETL